jgi:alkylation response protein AidB-like acyl-CoA dehydrogenase
MDYKLSEEQEMLKTMARDFMTDKFPKSDLKQIIATEEGYSPAIWKEMADLGWMGLVIPEEYGGTGMSVVDLAILLQEMGRGCNPGPFFATVVLGAMTIMDAGTEEQKQEYLPKIASGEAIFTYATLEGSTNDNPACSETAAVADGDDYVISGTTVFVPWANVADYIICAARTDKDGEPFAGVTLFIVDTKSEGIKTTVLKTMDESKLCEVVFDKVRVPAGNILGGLNGGSVMGKIGARATALTCCDMLGTLEAVLDMTVQYAKDRQQFSQPIGKFQIIQHYCANMATDIDGLKFVTYRAAWTLNEGEPANIETAVARAWAIEAAERVTALAHQIHGAIGCTEDHDLQYYTKRVKVASCAYGDADFCREMIAGSMGL